MQGAVTDRILAPSPRTTQWNKLHHERNLMLRYQQLKPNAQTPENFTWLAPGES
jgi:hypothetical protein